MATAAETLTAGNATGSSATGTGATVPTGLPGTEFTPPSWADSVKDTEVKSWLQNKAYPDAEHALKAHRSLEQLMGADKAGRTLLVPKDDSDIEGWKAVASKLGVPANPADYKLPVPEGMDGGFANTASTWFHEAGVPPRMAKFVAEKWNGWVAEQVKAGEQQEAAESAKQMKGLESEWGNKYTENTELARRGLREFGSKFGLDDAALKRAESVLGAANLVKFFHGLGSLNAESSFAGNDGGGSFGISPQAARKELNGYYADRSAGKINDYQWAKEIEPRINKLAQVLSRGS